MSYTNKRGLEKNTRCISVIYIKENSELYKTPSNIWEPHESNIVPSAYFKAGLSSVNENQMCLMSRLGNTIVDCVFPCSHENVFSQCKQKYHIIKGHLKTSMHWPVMIPTWFGHEATEPVITRCNCSWFSWKTVLFRNLFFIIFNTVCACGSLCECARPAETRDIRCPEARVTGGCEPLDMGTENQIRSPGKAVLTLNHEAISTVSSKVIF